jgi:hypothetical protein
MQKDVVYIDVEDDITAIIGKVKASKEKIVALVPPKRVGVLQSAVNLRLIARAAHGSHKHLVLITNNHALMALAAAAKIPVAKNLQSKPELAEIPALQVDDDDDIIDGESLPASELAKSKSKSSSSSVPDDAVEDLDIDDDTPKAAPPSAHSGPSKPRVKSGIKVPSFDTFRKKLFLYIGFGILFIAFLIWAIFFAARATVVIEARTTPTDVKTSVAIGPALATDAEASTLKSVQMQDKQSGTVEFDATGTDEVGDKATGTMDVKRTSISSTPVTIPVGTAFSSGGYTFFNTEAVVLEGTSIGPGGLIQDSATIKVIAQAIGEEYNLSARSYTPAVSGISADGSAMSGGTKRQIKVVTQSDVVKATEQLNKQNQDDIKKKLTKKFDKNTVVIDDSFQATPAAPVSVPAVGGELKEAHAKLTSEVTYTMSGVTKGDLSSYLKSALEKQMNRDEQRVYSDGAKDAKLTGFKATNGNTTVALAATGRIGPKIDDDEIKELVKGKGFGDIQTELKKIEGVNDAETKFWPFWVNTVPSDTKKIKIEFKLQDESK